MELVLVAILTAVVTTIVSYFVFRPKTVGTLRIDKSDPDDGPYMFLELDKGVGDISNNTYVTFRVSTEGYISHE